MVDINISKYEILDKFQSCFRAGDSYKAVIPFGWNLWDGFSAVQVLSFK